MDCPAVVPIATLPIATKYNISEFSLEVIRDNRLTTVAVESTISWDQDSSHDALPVVGSATIECTLKRTYLISSPYHKLENQLDLRPLAKPLRVFAFALTFLAPIRTDYATASYVEAFNWAHVFAVLRFACNQAGVVWQAQQFYVVIFRSRLRESADRTRLGELDRRSHEEACAAGGLLKYWFGSPDNERRNLATCIWRNREDAAVGGRGPWHRKAREAVQDMYEEITFHTHKLAVEAGRPVYAFTAYARYLTTIGFSCWIYDLLLFLKMEGSTNSARSHSHFRNDRVNIYAACQCQH